MPVPLRVAIAVQTLAVSLTPITAGLLLSVPKGHPLHSATSYTLFVVAVLHDHGRPYRHQGYRPAGQGRRRPGGQRRRRKGPTVVDAQGRQPPMLLPFVQEIRTVPGTHVPEGMAGIGRDNRGVVAGLSGRDGARRVHWPA